MCGRYVLATEDEELRVRFGLERSDYSFEPRYNIAPDTKTSNPVISIFENKSLVPMRWGLVPFWQEDPFKGRNIINAKGETVHEKKTFKRAFEERRCLVPATGFYEWQAPSKTSKKKQPYYIHMRDDSIFAMAGIWSTWKNEETTFDSYAIITIEPNEMMQEIHNRMPVILNKSDEELWLNPDTETDRLLELLRPYPAAEMDAYRVSTDVNKPVFDSEECLKRID